MARLLVVEDERNVLYSIQKGLMSDTLTVDVARTGRQGLEMVQKDRPDAVILDVRLGDMSGMDLFDQIRAFDTRLPVIIIAAYAATETAIEAMKRGAFEFLLKPLDFHQLREVVQRALEVSRFRHVPPSSSMNRRPRTPTASSAAEPEHARGLQDGRPGGPPRRHRAD